MTTADDERTRDGAPDTVDDAANDTVDNTAGHHPVGHARNRFRERGWRIATPLVFALSGALFLISAASSDGNDLRPGRVTTMASLVQSESNQLEDLQAEARSLNQQVDDLSAAVDDETVQRARTEARSKRAAAGF